MLLKTGARVKRALAAGGGARLRWSRGMRASYGEVSP